jgi:hypothetical protein
MSPSWRPMAPEDLESVERLGNTIHQAHPERPEVFAERLRLCPEGCHALGNLDGYIISHPWTLGSPPPLDTLLGALPAQPDTWYIQDLALHERARGTGAAQAIVARLAAAHALPLSLIAVGRSPGFWARQGFATATLPQGKLTSYGDGATYMIKRK